MEVWWRAGMHVVLLKDPSCFFLGLDRSCFFSPVLGFHPVYFQAAIKWDFHVRLPIALESSALSLAPTSLNPPHIRADTPHIDPNATSYILYHNHEVLFL